MEASALVTGGASGLGAATADRLAAEGLSVTRLDRATGAGVLEGDVTRSDDLAAAVAAEMPLADEETDQQASVERVVFGERRHVVSP
jgi:NAD(P)-dependent dehydrogenase (short-subunit alcohol dehydrogenase family)